MSNRYKDVDIHKITYKRSKKNMWDFENQIEFENYYKRLKMLAISVFEWKNLPNGIDSVYLERILYEQGKAVFFKDEDMMDENDNCPFIALRVALNGRLSLYGIPKFRQAYANNGYKKHLNDKESVIIYDNILHQTIDEIVFAYARRLSIVERIIDVNLNHTRHPFLISTDEKGKEMMEKLFNDITANKPYIIGDKDFLDNMSKGSEVLNLNAPFVVDKLMDYKHTLMNEVLTVLGIGNSSQDKRERLVSAEMDIVNTQNDAYALVRLRARLQARDKIRVMFPELKDIDVGFYQSEAGLDEEEEMEGKEDGTQNDKT